MHSAKENITRLETTKKNCKALKIYNENHIYFTTLHPFLEDPLKILISPAVLGWQSQNYFEAKS